MLKQVIQSLSLCVLAIAASFAHASDYQNTAGTQSTPETTLEKQPVFLFCPHVEQKGAWSLYVLVDKKAPSKPLAIGLEVLDGKNSKDITYNGVLAAQKDPATHRSPLGQLDAKDFGTSKLEVKENNMLSIGVTPEKDGLHLEINARISLDQFFMVGGAQRNQRDLVLQYSYVNHAWVAKSPTLQDNTGHNAAGKFKLALTGIVFLASSTGVSRIAAVDDLGAAIMLMDR